MQVLAGSAAHAGAITELNGPRPLEKIGAGELRLWTVNTYTGGTRVSQGFLSANVTGALGTGPVTINPTGAAGVIFAGSASAETLSINLANAGSVLGFVDYASAGDATIINNGRVGFAENAGADRATLKNNTGGQLDISGLTSGAMSIGSLSGGGVVSLGAKTLTLGGLNRNDTIGGIIQDGGAAIGGNLVKTGLDKLTLTGINTYTGATTVSGGTLSVNGSIASSPLTTVNAGAALGGNGTVGNTLISGGKLARGIRDFVFLAHADPVLCASVTQIVSAIQTDRAGEASGQTAQSRRTL